MDKEKIIASGLLHQYVLGLTSEEENLEVERHLLAFPELRQELAALQSALRQYAQKQGIPPPPRRQPASPLPKNTASKKAILSYLPVGILVAAILGLWFGQLHWSRTRIAALEGELNTCAKAQSRQQAVFRQYAQAISPGTIPVTLHGTRLAPQVLSVILWNPGEKIALFNPEGLPEPPSGHQYQVWADVEGQMVNLGIVDPNLPDLQPIGFAENAHSLNITIEPLGGSRQPTVSQLLANGSF